jgi:hypothetical protein
MTVRFDLQKISPLHVVYTLNAVGAALSALIAVITFGIAERVAMDLTIPNRMLLMADAMIMSPLVASILSVWSSHRLISDERRVAACIIAMLPVVCAIGVYVVWVRA